MKYFKKFLLLGIFALCGVSFCSAGSITYSGHFDNSTDYRYAIYGSNSLSIFLPSLSYTGSFSSYSNTTLNCNIRNLQFGSGLYDQISSSYISALWWRLGNSSTKFGFYPASSQFGNTVSYSSISDFSNFDLSFTSSIGGSSTHYSFGFALSFFQLINSSVCNDGNVVCSISGDYTCTLSGDYINNIVSSNSCDYSEYESEISFLQSNLAIATGNLAICNSNLAAATGNLATCQSDLTICQNSSSSSGTGSCSISDKISENIIFSGSKDFSNAGYTNMFNYGDYGAGTYCLKFTSSNAQTLTMGFANGGTTAPTNLYSLYNDQYGNWICLYGNKPYLNVKLNSSSNTISYEVYKLVDLYSTSIPCVNGGSSSCDYSGYILESNVTQNYCTNRYQNLIPESDITSSYCEVEFGLIDPVNCPSSPSGTGDIQRSALYIDNVQYLGSPNIYINVNDILEYSMTYVSGSAIIDVEGYKADTGYMADILTVQEYHPSSEDFTVAFVSFLTLGLPYVVVILFVVFIRKLIRKIFKS